ncbi:MAG: PBP1A family penicillin-binding protein [Chitinivibrionia bacterium]|nr:PBP1A family penicillin-binding protein [Chitinivibrionia bacterium]
MEIVASAEKPDKKINVTPIIIIAIMIFFFTSAALTIMAVVFLENVYKTLPEPQELADIQPSLVTKVYAKDSSLVHEFSIERRFWVEIDSIPDALKYAVVAIEDRRFRAHWGVDLKRMISAVFGNIARGGYDQGASTITQQLARNIYFTQKKTMSRKFREILTAVQLEKYYTKDEILELYLNTIYLGSGVYGVSAAAQQYFSKNIKDIDLNEAAVLAGTIQLPEHYRPDREKNLERITIRRRSVLNGMARMKVISKAEADSVSKLEIPNEPYVPISTIAPYFVEQVRRELERKYGSNMLYNGGLSIYTTLDPQAQLAAEQALKQHLDTLQRTQNRFFIDNARAYALIGVSRDKLMSNFDSIYSANAKVFDALHDSISLRKLQASVIAMDVETGAVRVMIGGKDYSQSKFNRAMQGLRQPGSAFKPFVYAAAMQSGFTPASVVVDRPVTIDTWRPENHDKEFFGEMTIRQALRRSINLVAVQVAQETGLRKIVDLAKAMGFSSNLQAVPAISLGGCEVSNLEITRAYAAFGNQGLMPQQYFIETVTDKNGKVISRHTPESRQVIDPGLASLMTSLLQDVVMRGTAASIRSTYFFMRPSAGKTGTTNQYTDAWYVGYTPQISCGVWVGTDRTQTMGHGVTGTRGAIPIWVPTMKSLHRNLPEENFTYSGGLVNREICLTSYGLASIYCPSSYAEIFLVSAIPQECTIHSPNAKRDTTNVLDFFGTQQQQKTTNGNNLMF